MNARHQKLAHDMFGEIQSHDNSDEYCTDTADLAEHMNWSPEERIDEWRNVVATISVDTQVLDAVIHQARNFSLGDVDDVIDILVGILDDYYFTGTGTSDPIADYNRAMGVI